MKQVINDEQFGKIVYKESFWLGKKELYINNKRAIATGKKSFRLTDEENQNLKITVVGNYISGVKLLIDTKSIKVVEKSKWYEYTIAIAGAVLFIIWGNVPALCMIAPLVGGAIGGAITGLCEFSNLILMKQVKNPILKILIGLGVVAVNFLICFLLAMLIIKVQ